MSESHDLNSMDITSILQPVLLHRWTIDTSLPEELNQLLKRQIIKCSINIVKKTFSLEVEQPMRYGNRMFYIMEILSKGATSITIQALTANEPYDMVGIEATLVDHNYVQDYSAPSDTAKHILEFEF